MSGVSARPIFMPCFDWLEQPGRLVGTALLRLVGTTLLRLVGTAPGDAAHVSTLSRAPESGRDVLRCCKVAYRDQKHPVLQQEMVEKCHAVTTWQFSTISPVNPPLLIPASPGQPGRLRFAFAGPSGPVGSVSLGLSLLARWPHPSRFAPSAPFGPSAPSGPVQLRGAVFESRIAQTRG